MPAIHRTVLKEEIQSDGDSSSDDWSSLAVIKIIHLSDYCMRALAVLPCYAASQYCTFLLHYVLARKDTTLPHC